MRLAKVTDMGFIGAMAAAIHIGTYFKVHLIAPFQHFEKSQIVTEGDYLNAPLGLTWSCYYGGNKHCGTCPTCRARKEAFVMAGMPDPTEYVTGDDIPV